METNCDQTQEVTYMTSIFDKDKDGCVHIHISDAQYYFPIGNGPEELKKLDKSMHTVPAEQIEILQKLYPKSWEKYKFIGKNEVRYSISWEIPTH